MEYSLYLDEQDSSKDNPFFCLAGLAISRDVYENSMIPNVNGLKVKYFGRTDVIFHYTEMKGNAGEFEIFLDGTKRNAFWQEFNRITNAIDFNTIGVYLHKQNCFDVYGLKSNKAYEFAFRRLVSNYIAFLKGKNACGNIIFESRSWKENAMIQGSFNHVMSCGTDIFPADVCQKYLSTIGFITKKDNCVGIQIADFVPNSFVRHINNQKNFNNVGTNFIRKIYNPNGNYADICGLKRIL